MEAVGSPHASAGLTRPTGPVKLAHVVGRLDQARTELLRYPKAKPGVDGMTIIDLRQLDFGALKWRLRNGNHLWSSTRRAPFRKQEGGYRWLSIPTVLDRLVLRATMLALTPTWEPLFSESSYGFRLGRDVFQAATRALEFVQAGRIWVAKVDVTKFFDRVPQELALRLLRPSVDKKLLALVRTSLRAHRPGGVGLGQGSPLSPLLGNVVLNLLDHELEGRGIAFIRYADDVSLFLKSQRAARRIMASVSSWLTDRLALTVNLDKSRVVPYTQTTILGLLITEGLTLEPSPIAIRRLRERLSSLEPGMCPDPIVRGWLSHYGRLLSTRRDAPEEVA